MKAKYGDILVIFSENRNQTGKPFLESSNLVFEFTEVWGNLFKKEKKDNLEQIETPTKPNYAFCVVKPLKKTNGYANMPAKYWLVYKTFFFDGD